LFLAVIVVALIFIPMPMKSIKKTVSLVILLFLIALFSGTGCAEAKRSKMIQKTKIDSCDLSEMGKNRYYHSSHYKRNISKSVKKIRRH
jgi:hypothetical protein